jgi:hypothetical protein
MNLVHLFRVVVFAASPLASPLCGQAIFSNTITGTNPNLSNPFTTGQTVSSGLSVSGIGRGSGISGSNANDRYSATGWNSASFDSNDYFTWTLTPAAGTKLNLVSLTYTGQASASGPVNFTLRSSVDSFTTAIGTPTATGTTITLTSPSFQGLTSSVEFRLYGWAGSSGLGTFSVNDFTFSGTLSAVPEPSTYAAIVGSAAFGAVVVVRRRGRTRGNFSESARASPERVET